jgi:hypothetical protein
MSRLVLAILAASLFMAASPASAYVWRCHTPSGDVWTSQPPQSGDCEEYDGTFNPSAVPPAAPPVQYAQPQYAPPPPPPPVYAYPYPTPYPVPVPYPYYPYPRYPRYYGGPGLYLGVPPLVFDFRFGSGGRDFRFGYGGRIGGRHFRGHRWR